MNKVALVSVRFVNSEEQKKLSEKSYKYIITDSELYDKIRYCMTSFLPEGFNITNDNGYTYRNSLVIFNSIEFVDEDKVHNECGWLFNRIVDANHIKTLSEFDAPTWICPPKWPDNDTEVCLAASNCSDKDRDALFVWHSDTNSTSIAAHCVGSAIVSSDVSALVERIEALENERTEKMSKEKENYSMFESIKNSIKFGVAKDVRMSIYGPAFQGAHEGSPSWYAYNNNTLVDVTDMVFDSMKLFYMMPVAQNAIKVGDFIWHGSQWVKVINILNNGRVEAESIWLREVVTILPTTNIFGFNFYTKLVPLIENFSTNCAATTTNPFGMLPMLMAMSDNKSDDMSEMLLMSMMMNGGQTNNSFNPMMLMLLSNSDNKGKKMDNLLSLMLAYNAMPVVMAPAAVSAIPAASKNIEEI